MFVKVKFSVLFGVFDVVLFRCTIVVSMMICLVTKLPISVHFLLWISTQWFLPWSRIFVPRLEAVFRLTTIVDMHRLQCCHAGNDKLTPFGTIFCFIFVSIVIS